MKKKPFSLKSWRWSGGGLLVLVSMGLHGLLLAMPTPRASTPPEAVMTLASLRDNPSPAISPTDTIDVVRLPQFADTAPTDTASTDTASTDTASPATPSPNSTAVPPAPSAKRVAPQPSAAPAPSQAAPVATERPTPERPTPERPTPERPTPEHPAPEPAPPEPKPEPEPTPPGLVHNNKTVELATDTRDFLAWYLDQNWEGLGVEPLPAPRELARLQVPYEGTVCLPIPPVPGRLEVIVGSNGQLYRAPRLLATTGYDDLDAAALALAAQQDFSEAAQPTQESPTVYWLAMEVLYQGPSCSPN